MLHRLGRFVPLAFVCTLGTAVQAQQVPLRDLPAAATEIEEPFSQVASAIEIKPGTLVVYDGVEIELAVVDFATGARTALGRTGSGPGEYRAVGGVFRMAGDTIWILDAVQMRVTVYSPSLEPGTTFPFMLFDAQTGTVLTAPMFADGRGNIYASAMALDMARGRGAGGQMRLPDSVAIVRVDPRAGATRTEIARVRYPTTGQPQMEQNGNALKFTMAYPGLVASDPWTVFRDGRVAIVRGATYSVQFIGADGKASSPVRVAYEPIRVTEADQKAEMDDARRQMEEQSKAMQKMMPPNIQMTFELTPPPSWPEHYPPVAPLGVLPAPDGRLWVKRGTPVRVGREQWDVLDQQGKLVARWRLPAKTTIAAVGQGVVYTVRTDEDDLRYVQRVDLPR